jgi:hypothetical protein
MCSQTLQSTKIISATVQTTVLLYVTTISIPRKLIFKKPFPLATGKVRRHRLFLSRPLTKASHHHRSSQPACMMIIMMIIMMMIMRGETRSFFHG